MWLFCAGITVGMVVGFVIAAAMESYASRVLYGNKKVGSGMFENP